MAPGSTRPLAEMSTRNLPWGKGQLAHEADNITICKLTFWNTWEPLHLTTVWVPPQPVTGIALPSYLTQ
jgi:hypothetical protein